MDTTDSTVDEETASEAIQNITDEYNLDTSETEHMYVTSAPTFVPTKVPTTSIPTTSPSITGTKVLVLVV